LVIKNYGNSAAFNVSLVFSRPLERYGQTKISPVEEKTFKIMAPGYEWRTFWDSFPDSDGLSMPDEFLANVSYEWDNPRKSEKSELSFDIKSLMGMKWIGGPTIEESLQKIAESVTSKAKPRRSRKMTHVCSLKVTRIESTSMHTDLNLFLHCERQRSCLLYLLDERVDTL
jgi:hypothetical protein